MSCSLCAPAMEEMQDQERDWIMQGQVHLFLLPFQNSKVQIRLGNKQTKKQNKKPLVSVFMFIQLFEQIRRLKELGIREEVHPTPGHRVGWHIGCPQWWQRDVGGQPSTISRINYWHWEDSLVDGFPWLYSLILGIYAAGDPAGHLIGKPRVLQLSFVEFQPHTPIWIMYSFRSQGWALNKA